MYARTHHGRHRIPSTGTIRMRTFIEYLLFKKFILPAIMQFMFWSGIGGTLYGTWWLYTHDN